MATRIEKTDLARDALYDKVNTMIDEVNTKIDNKDSLPSQTGNTGKFLTTDGTNASWREVKQIEIKQDLTNPTIDTVPSTKAVADESSRITTLMNTKVSNCITEIPQDIKLELNNGTLTLKAGSKVYIPNGFEADRHTPKFDKVVIESDIIVDSPTIDGPIFIYYANKNVIGVEDKYQCSGPHLTVDYGLWYNTRNNYISFIAGGEVSEDNASLPLAIINASNGKITSIDQVFNGFGYIGSTVFALPGVKGLIPNGRNADGSLKSIEFTVDRVLTGTIRDRDTRDNVVIGFSPYYRNFFGFSLSAYYDGNTNFNKENGSNWPFALIGNASYSAANFTSFTPKTAFHSVDYNEYIEYVHEVNGKQDKSTAVNYNNITNCITEIPQDIKLELNNGTLTLKAGSKVYIPNGFESDGVTPKFDVVVIESDTSVSSTGRNGLLFYNKDNNALLIENDTRIFSGSTHPDVSSSYYIWYDTSSNLIKRFSNASTNPSYYTSLPLAYIERDSESIKNISQVFNGFGYIGSTVFALPGVKGLIPNGRNEDGSLKNIEVSVRDIDVKTYKNFTLVEHWDMIIDFGGVGLSRVVYDEKNNNILQKSSGNITSQLKVASISFDSNSKITSFTPKTPFHALDYNDKSTISGWSMPSDKYIDLTLGANGTTYIAPANGYFYVKKDFTTSGQYIWFGLYNSTDTVMDITFWGSNGGFIGGFIPVSKGSKVGIHYNASGSTLSFRFIYAEGDKPSNVVSSDNADGPGGIDGIGGSTGSVGDNGML